MLTYFPRCSRKSSYFPSLTSSIWSGLLHHTSSILWIFSQGGCLMDQGYSPSPHLPHQQRTSSLSSLHHRFFLPRSFSDLSLKTFSSTWNNMFSFHKELSLPVMPKMHLFQLSPVTYWFYSIFILCFILLFVCPLWVRQDIYLRF